MKKRMLFLLTILMLLFTTTALGQEASEKIYPSQFATVAEYQEATGNEITSYQEAPSMFR